MSAADGRLRGRLGEGAALGAGLLAVWFVHRAVLSLYFASDTWGDLWASTNNPFIYLFKDTYGGAGRHYRPVWRFAGWVEHVLSGGDIFAPRVYFAAAMLWHSLAAAGVYAAARFAGAGRVAAVAGMLLFALHPATVEAVAWTAAESFLLAGMFGAWSLALCLRGGRRCKVASLALAVLAMLSNETGLAVPGLLLLAQLHRERRPGRFGLAALALPAIYIAWRLVIFGGHLATWWPEHAPPPVTRLSEFSDFFKTLPGVLLWNNWPAWLDQKIALLDPWLYLAMAATGTTALVWLGWRRREPWAVAALGVLVAALPNIATHRLWPTEVDPVPFSINNQRTLYLAVAMWGLLGAAAVEGFRRTASLAAYRAVLVAAAVVIAGNAVATQLNLFYWQRSGDMVRRFVATLPDAVPVPPRDLPLAIVSPPPFTRFPYVEGMNTNAAYTFLVATEDAVRFAYRDRSVASIILAKPEEASPGQVVVQLEEDGTARRVR